MKILREVATEAAKTMGWMFGRDADVEKRKGLYVSRPVLNGDAWAKWAADWKIPNPVPAAEMHVTVLYSAVDVKMKRDDDVISVLTGRACFVMLGATDQCLCLALPAWQLKDRNWDFVKAGAVETWPIYTPHMTLSYDAVGFELSDDAISAMPETVILGGEMNAALGATPEPDLVEAEGADDMEGMNADLIFITEIFCSAAKAALESGEGLDVFKASALRDIVKREKVPASTIAVLKSLRPDLPSAKVRKSVDVDVTVTMKPLSTEIAKGLGEDAGAFNLDDERHLVWGIASVSKVGGQDVVDDIDDVFTTRALEEFTIDLIKNQRGGKFEHEGQTVNHIVQALVLSEELQKALGIDLGYEPLITCTEVPDDAAWADVKKGKWMQSIAGTFTYYEDDQADA